VVCGAKKEHSLYCANTKHQAVVALPNAPTRTKYLHGALIVPQHPDYYPHIQKHAQVMLEYCAHLHIIAVFDQAPKLNLKNTQFYAAHKREAQGILGFIGLIWNNLQLLCSIKPSVIEAIDPPSQIAAFIYSTFYKAKWLYFSMELFTETPPLRNKPIKKAIWHYCEKWCLHKNTPVATVCQSVAQVLSKKLKRPVHVVRNIPETPAHTAQQNAQSSKHSGHSNLSTPTLRQQIGAPNDFIVLYQGALEQGRGLLSFPKWITECKKYQLVIIGDGPLYPQLQQEYKNHSQIHLLGRIPYEALLPITRQANAGIVWIEPLAQSYRLSLPGKLFEYLHAGIPVLGSPLPEIQSHIEQYQFGVCANTLEKESFLKALQQLEANESMLRQNIPYAQGELCWEKESKQLKAIFENFS
jgi:glycosyltransferase involved in cell wall biosynthesis